MSYSNPSDVTSSTGKTTLKKLITNISPEKILLNEKLMFGLMLTGMALTFFAWSVRKNK